MESGRDTLSGPAQDVEVTSSGKNLVSCGLQLSSEGCRSALPEPLWTVFVLNLLNNHQEQVFLEIVCCSGDYRTGNAEPRKIEAKGLRLRYFCAAT